MDRNNNKLKNWRRVAMRYDKTAASFLAFVTIMFVRGKLREIASRIADLFARVISIEPDNILAISMSYGGAAWVTRTPDPRITNAMLYQLS